MARATTDSALGRRALGILTLLLAVWLSAPAIAQFVRPYPTSAPATSSAPAGEEATAATATADKPAAPPGETGAAATPPDAGPPQLSEEEIAALKTQYNALPPDQQAEMKAYYKDLGIDLNEVLGLSTEEMEATARVQMMLDMLRGMEFARTPPNVLAARAKIGFGQIPHPNPAIAQGGDIARWVHLQVMAGEWSALGAYLAQRPTDEAQKLYSVIVQSLNRGNFELLPEEVLALAEIAPEEPKGWQITAFAAMLKIAVAKNSPGAMLAQITAGTKFFGGGNPQRRRRTVDLLAGGGLVAQAYEYLPPLADARSVGDGDLILVHALYQADLAVRAGEGPAAEQHRSAAWDLFCEASLSARASMLTKREAIKQNVTLMSRMPRSRVTPWLRQVFADDELGPAALETIALSAVVVGEKKEGNEEQRAQAILTAKEAVDVLLERAGLDRSALRVPMRMLTTALVAEMENTVAQKGKERMVAAESQLLLRAIPSQAWFDALEPSLATRADNACIAIATIADETDLALSLLADALKRTPDQAIQIADAFLKTWEMRLSPSDEIDEDAYIYYYWRGFLAQAPLTRGRQRRNLERLERLMTTLREIGVDPRVLPTIAAAFKSCHGVTEVYDRADVQRVFGAFDQIPAATSAGLAQTMAASLNGDWRNRAAQIKQGVKRTDTEIAALVDKGYGVAIELIDGALVREPDSWRFAVIKAGLSYDRLQFRQQQKKSGDPAKEAEYRAAAFAAFEQAAQRYAAAIAAGEEREDIGVYARWFGAAMGTSQLNFLNADDMPADGTPQDDQVERIKKAIAALPPDAAFRHVSEFARALGAAVARSDPEVKPKLVKHALRVVGDHPAGASLRALSELYRDLVKDEIKLRLTIDGDDRVGAGRQFAVLVSLRFTNAVDRETGGFSKYLQTSTYVRVGRQYQEVNFREKLQKNIETTFAKGFVIESIGFFDPYMPAEGVVEGGQDGWLEKPMVYLVLSRSDPTVDRLPQLTMDMQFEDQTGAVTLVLPSNTPPLAIEPPSAPAAAARPCLDLQVTQVVDPRDARDGEKDRTIKLEVICRGKGTAPELRDLLTGLDSAIDGYRIDEKGIEPKPTVVVQEGDASSSRYYWGPPKPPEGGYPERDASGMYRLGVERSWLVTYTPAGGSLGTEFRVPALKEGVQATLVSRYFSDMDLVPVAAGLVPVVRSRLFWPIAGGAAALLLLIGGLIVYRRLRPRAATASDGFTLPQRVTPLSTVMLLRRIAAEHGPRLDEVRRGDLDRDIAMIERKYFAPGNGEPHDGELGAVLTRWSAAVRG